MMAGSFMEAGDGMQRRMMRWWVLVVVRCSSRTFYFGIGASMKGD